MCEASSRRPGTIVSNLWPPITTKGIIGSSSPPSLVETSPKAEGKSTTKRKSARHRGELSVGRRFSSCSICKRLRNPLRTQEDSDQKECPSSSFSSFNFSPCDPPDSLRCRSTNASYSCSAPDSCVISSSNSSVASSSSSFTSYPFSYVHRRNFLNWAFIKRLPYPLPSYNNLWGCTAVSNSSRSHNNSSIGKCQQSSSSTSLERCGGTQGAGIPVKGSSPFPFHLVFTAVLVFLVASLPTASAKGLVLSDHILHFEPVFYDETHFRSQHHRAKRDVNHVVRLHFTAHNRVFKLRLRRDTSIFADDVVFETSDGPVDFDFSKVYTGFLEDDDLAQVEGVVTKEGLFDGHVATPNELYYLEPAHRYLEGAEFHSVMYKASDVSHPTLSRCASQQLHLRGRVHTPWGSPNEFEKDSSGLPFEPLGVPVGPEQVAQGGEPETEWNRNKFSGTSAPSSSYSSISSSEVHFPLAADVVPTPKPQKGVNSKHKAVMTHKPLHDVTSDNGEEKFTSLPPVISSVPSPLPTKPSLSYHEKNSFSASNFQSCTEETSCRLSYTNNKKSNFDNKSSHFLKKFKHIQHSANPQSFAGTQSKYTHPKQHKDNENKNNVASRHNSSSSAPFPNNNHLDFELVYEPTGEKNGIPSQHSLKYGQRKASSKPPVFPEFSQPWYKRTPRNKRSSVDSQKTTCMLYLQADHLFYEKIGSEEACIDVITRHVQRVNNIYKVTDFDSDKQADEIGFMIKRIKIHTAKDLADPGYRFPGNYGVEKFLELFSEEDYDAFCLAYMFTYRDFEGGTLGLAWTGDLKNAGGVCEKNGHYRGSLKSLNTGIVTLLNYGKHVPPAVSHVTLAHEIGHNFGSPHDPETDTKCTPGGPRGNYIMYARATSGDKQNNNKFSPCSLRQINNVLNSKARDSKGCFTQPQAAICGNGVVEVGEECDCGWEEDCEEACCFPMKTNPKNGETPCTLRPNKVCSPSQGPCCTNDCHLKVRDKCRDDNGCRDSSFCNGRYPECPPSTNKPNKTICNEEFVCYKGECSGSICLAYGLESCQCSRNRGDPITKSCELCCKLPGEHQVCLSSFEWNVVPYDIPDMYAKPGTPCNDYKGYCDVFKKCREVDPSGPLATLRGILLSDESLASLQQWIIEHWYAVLFVILAVLVLLVGIVKVFGKRPEKKKRGKKNVRHKSNGTTQYTNPSTAATASNGILEGATNHVVHPTVVRTNLPFKRRVNEVRRAATKAKRAAKSQLSRPTKKSSRAADGAVTSPTDSEKSGPGLAEGAIAHNSAHGKDRISSRFSIISFKTFRPKSLSPDKHKSKSPEKRKSKSGSNDKKSKVKSSKNHHRSRSPDKKRRAEGRTAESPDKHRRSRSPNKRTTLEDGRRKSRNHSVSPEKIRRASSPEKIQRHRTRSPDKHRKMSEGNWLINKFLADEEMTAKPIVNGSLIGSCNGSVSSGLGGPNGSPQIGPIRNGSTRGLLSNDSNRASPIRGIINEAFVSSPRGARTHSSLRITKSVSPEGLDFDFGPNKYRRSISMEAYNKPPVSPDKRKRPVLDEGISPDKRRRFSSPEKTQKKHSPSKEYKFSHSDRTRHSIAVDKRRSISPPIPKPSSYSSVPEQLREKLSLITASLSGSVTSILPPSEPVDNVSLHSSSHSTHSMRGQPKDWV